MPFDSDWLALTELCTRYSCGLDSKDYELLRTCFTDDAHTSYGTGNAGVSRDELTYETPDAMIAAMRRIHARLQTMHRNTNHRFTIHGDRATGRVYLDQFQLRDGQSDDPRTTQYFAWYDDVYVRTTDGWKIQERHATTVWVTGGWIGEGAAETR